LAEVNDVDAPAEALGDRFELLSKLGRGGMGVVYRAFDRERGVQVALKTLRSVNPGQVLRFKAEFRALRDLRHPNLIELGELFEQDGNWYFTMELIEGVNFLEYVRGAVTLADPSTVGTTLDGSATLETDIASPRGLSGRSAAAEAREIVRVARPQCDQARLREALAGLARGLAALHDAGKVHRDIKPSNIIVDSGGRVVLLDFGVVAELTASMTFERDRMVGTVSYMAPEQAAGGAVGPAADWYAVGVLTFQSLTGQLPFTGDPDTLLVGKQTLRPPRPRDVADGIAPDLQALCEGLLLRDPEQRAGADATFAALGIDRTTDSWIYAPPSTEGRLFIGRASELESLEAAFEDSLSHSVCAFVEGESGVGKSAMVDRFVATQRADEPHLIVLRGRCHERERVPYNAFDGVVDDLTRYLLGRRDAKLERLIPDRIADLLQLFPALRAVSVFADRAAMSGQQPRASDARGGAFAALRQLIRRMTERRPLLLAIDDVQWADRDSVALLEELVHGPGSPALLLIATQRTGQGAPISREVEQFAEDSRRIELAGLTAAESEQLARDLLATTEGDTADVAQIATEARGHPMFIQELVQHAGHQRESSEPLRLDDAISARASRLDAAAHMLLEVVAVAGAPIPQSIAFEAARLTPKQASAHVAALLGGGFARVTGARGHDAIETYHDRVREAVYANLAPERRRELHRAIAVGLDAVGAPPDSLVRHFEAAGDTERAEHYVVAAAEAAYDAMAFGRAAELYGRALAAETDPVRRSALQETLGDALCNDGRSTEAAECFLEAAQHEDDATRKLDLQRRAAERLLMSGHMQRGVETARAVLGELGTSVPSSKARIIASILWNQLRLRGHSLTWKPREPTQGNRLRSDVFWSLASGFSMVDVLLGAYFGTRAPMIAFKLGEPMQIARALSAAAIGAAIMGRREQVSRLMAATERAAEEDGGPLARYYLTHARTAALFVRDNDWHGCLASIDELRPLWREAGRGPGWETDVTTHFEIASYQLLGEYKKLAQRVRAAVRAGQRTGNLFLEVSLRVRFAGRHFVHGRWKDALDDVDDAIAAWIPESHSFGNQRAWALWSKSRIAACSRELERFTPALDEEWGRMRRSLTGRVPLMRVEWQAAYGTYLCAKAQLAKRRGNHSEHARLCRAATRHADDVSKLPFPAATWAEWMVRASVAWARGDPDRALSDTRRALELHRAHPSHVFEWALQRRVGELLGGSEGEALIAEAEREGAAHGITDLPTFCEAAIPTSAVAG
jgi:serine/threonine protein kinase/tetratricopeptide (TPR) repeat protein